MISIKINDINNFMQHLLAKETFDNFLFYEGQISTASTFEFDGKINREFFDSEELTSLMDNFISWGKIRNVCFEIIKGKKVPTKLKLVLGLSKTHFNDIIYKSGSNHSDTDISGLYLHVNYEYDEIHIITGSSLNVFTLDKTIDHYWDKTTESFLSKYFNMEKI